MKNHSLEPCGKSLPGQLNGRCKGPGDQNTGCCGWRFVWQSESSKLGDQIMWARLGRKFSFIPATMRGHWRLLTVKEWEEEWIFIFERLWCNGGKNGSLQTDWKSHSTYTQTYRTYVYIFFPETCYLCAFLELLSEIMFRVSLLCVLKTSNTSYFLTFLYPPKCSNFIGKHRFGVFNTPPQCVRQNWL